MTFRIPTDLKKAFQKKATSTGLTQSEVFESLLEQYIAGEYVVTSEAAREDVVTATRLWMEEIQEHFSELIWTFSQRPLQFDLPEDLDFSWMFSEENLQAYYASKTAVINDNGWYLDDWLWIFTWVWLTVYGVKHAMPVEHLWKWWKQSEDAVFTALNNGPQKLRDSDAAREMMKIYTLEQGDTSKW
jgi:antitoxin component of RelBE/YafQ-DinJ toxin-antitoxin module